MHNNETGASVVNARYVHVHKINIYGPAVIDSDSKQSLQEEEKRP